MKSSPGLNDMNMRHICTTCKFYYITWDSSYPYGCKGFGMKSKYCPSLLVFKSSGKHCMVYEEKSKKKDAK